MSGSTGLILNSRAREGSRRGQSECHPDCGEQYALPDHHRFQCAVRRTHRDSDAQFPGTLRNRVGDHAVDPHDAEQQHHPAGDGQHHQRERAARHRRAIDLFHGANTRERQIPVHGPHRFAHLFHQTLRPWKTGGEAGKLKHAPPTALLGAGLHEDEAEFGGDFDDEIAARAGGAGRVELDELVGDGVQGPRGAIAEGRGAGTAEDAVDGFEEAGRVFGDEAESFAIDDDAVFAGGGLDGEVLFGRDAGEQDELEVGGSEAVEEGDEAIGVAAEQRPPIAAKARRWPRRLPSAIRERASSSTSEWATFGPVLTICLFISGKLVG